MTEECAFCGTKDRTLHYCSGCRQRKYCKQACHRAAWRAGHKEECKRLRAAVSSATAAAASTSRVPGGEGGGPIELPSSTAAAASSFDSSSRISTLEQNKQKGKFKTNTINGPAVSAAQPSATEKKSKPKNGEKTMWVTIFKCFNCGKRGHDLSRCARCEEAYYCDRDCQIAHARAHAKVCVATVAAKAQRAHRERIARAVREDGKDEVEGGEEDELCVICQSKPVNAVVVSESCVCVCVCARARVRARTPARACACACGCWKGSHPLHPLSTRGIFFATDVILILTQCTSLPTAAVWPQVLRGMRRGAATKGRGQIVPHLPYAASAWTRDALRPGFWDLQEDQGCDRSEPAWGRTGDPPRSTIFLVFLTRTD